MATIRLTMGQAVVNYLAAQYVERDGIENRFFAGLWGIFGHGNIGGIAQAVQQYGPGFPYYLSRNEQAMVHAAVGYAKQANRLATFACLSSIGPGATNMVTGAASATINHVPVLLLAGRYVRRARRRPRSCSSSSTARRRTSASTTPSGRSCATGTASTGPSRSSRPCRRSCAC